MTTIQAQQELNRQFQMLHDVDEYLDMLEVSIINHDPSFPAYGELKSLRQKISSELSALSMLIR